MQRLLTQDFQMQLFALPFTPRKVRETWLAHRPDQSQAVSPQALAEKHDLPYVRCESDVDIDDSCDVYLVLGAGILSAQCVANKSIVNCHPGVIPASRGLDSFKWALLEKKPLGITLHYIDAQVDAGEIISIVPTNVYPTDSLATLARRHYENEIDCLSRFTEFLDRPMNPFPDCEPGEARRRMPLDTERKLEKQFAQYKEKFGR